MNSGGAPKICARPNFWNDMITSWMRGQPMKTASMMNAGVRSASGAQGTPRFLRGVTGSDGPAGDDEGGADAGAGMVVMARLLLLIVSDAFGHGTGCPAHARHPV